MSFHGQQEAHLARLEDAAPQIDQRDALAAENEPRLEIDAVSWSRVSARAPYLTCSKAAPANGVYRLFHLDSVGEAQLPQDLAQLVGEALRH